MKTFSDIGFRNSFKIWLMFVCLASGLTSTIKSNPSIAEAAGSGKSFLLSLKANV